MNLNQLIEGCKKSHLKAQSELYYTYKDMLFTLCLKYCKNTVEAEDNLQDSFLNIFKHIHKYKGKGSFEGWMKRITINKAIDKYKDEKHLNIEINDNIITDTLIDNEILNIPLDQILNAITELPTQYRLVFNLYELDSYSHKEISKMLNISIGTSKSNLHRAKLILKNTIQTFKPSQLNALNYEK